MTGKDSNHECIDGCDHCDSESCVKTIGNHRSRCLCVCHTSPFCSPEDITEPISTQERLIIPATMLAMTIMFVVAGIVFCTFSQGCARLRCDDAGLACEHDASVDGDR